MNEYSWEKEHTLFLVLLFIGDTRFMSVKCQEWKAWFSLFSSMSNIEYTLSDNHTIVVIWELHRKYTSRTMLFRYFTLWNSIVLLYSNPTINNWIFYVSKLQNKGLKCTMYYEQLCDTIWKNNLTLILPTPKLISICY